MIIFTVASFYSTVYITWGACGRGNLDIDFANRIGRASRAHITSAIRIRKEVMMVNKDKRKKNEEIAKNASLAAGAVAGGTAAVGGVITGAATGTAGAAALTSGLATVGTIIGGGMFAGIAVVAAAPIAGAVAGYGIFRLYKKLASKRPNHSQ
jgi:hypothetical protein